MKKLLVLAALAALAMSCKGPSILSGTTYLEVSCAGLLPVDAVYLDGEAVAGPVPVGGFVSEEVEGGDRELSVQFHGILAKTSVTGYEMEPGCTYRVSLNVTWTDYSEHLTLVTVETEDRNGG
jgi:hypothetical protein